MANRICSYCGESYTDEQGPHPYEACVKRLDEQIDRLIDRMTTLNKRRRDAKMLVNEGSQKQ